MSEQRIRASVRRSVAERARGRCEYCRSQVRFAMQSFPVDYSMPRQAGGKTTRDNLALACQGCNGQKYAKTEAPDPVNDEIVQLFHPRQQRWSDHFTWSSDFTLIVGVTPTGRAAVDALQLNREGLVNLRRALCVMGEHPPKDPTNMSAKETTTSDDA